MATVTDPVCGMQVDPATAPARIVHADHTHYFCSEMCKTKFQADPARYGDTHMAHGHAHPHAGDAGGMERHEPPRTTSGDVTSPKFGSAGSGGLEFERIPEQHDHDK